MERFAHGWLAERDIRDEANVRLFCLPHAGSGAAAYYRWKRVLTGIDVCPVLLPGREMRLGEASVENVGRMVDAIAEVIAPYLDKPFAIFGHSMGALLAYELALRVREPLCLFVSGREAAHLPFGHRELHLLDDKAFVAELQRRYGGSSAVLEDAELREVFLPILRADLRLVESYRHGADVLLECPVMAFAGRDDASVSEVGLAGWGDLTRGEFATRRFEGDHFYYAGVGQDELLRVIGERLAGLTPHLISQSIQNK